MTDLAISLTLVAGIVLISEVTRRTATIFAKDYTIFFIEAISALQLCACTQEFKLLGEVGSIGPQIELTLTYIITVVHISTFHGASCNPSSALELAFRKEVSVRTALTLIACQFTAAYIARYLALYIWEFGLSDLHLRHKLIGYKCFSPINASLLAAWAVEMACAFVLQVVSLNIHKFDDKFRVHVIAAVITTLVYAGGNVTGAVFNPALAFSIQFPCSGHSFLEYCFVYWLGPFLGLAGAVLFFEKLVPFSSSKTTYQNGLEVHMPQPKKRQ